MVHAVQIIGLTVLAKLASCTIVGLTYMDSLDLAPSKGLLSGEDPCNPLYWYPRQIPDYCYAPKPVPIAAPPYPLPVPLPSPLPPQNPMPGRFLMPIPGPPPMPVPMPGPIPIPVPTYGAPHVPMVIQGYPPHLLPAPGQPYPVPAEQAGLVPGLEGLVSPDGAINVLPFSDAYSDLLEKHKQKMIRRRLQKLLDEYEYYPRRNKKRRCH